MQEMEPSYNIISLSWVGEAYVFRFLFIFFDEYSHTLHMRRVLTVDNSYREKWNSPDTKFDIFPSDLP